MCFSACHWANISEIVYGACMEDTVRVGLGGINVTCATMKKVGEVQSKLSETFCENLELYDLWLTARIREKIKRGG